MLKPQVLSGTPQALRETPLGLPQQISSFLNRYALVNKEACSDAPAHIAVHLIEGLDGAPDPYVCAHAHPTCD